MKALPTRTNRSLPLACSRNSTTTKLSPHLLNIETKLKSEETEFQFFLAKVYFGESFENIRCNYGNDRFSSNATAGGIF